MLRPDLGSITHQSQNIASPTTSSTQIDYGKMIFPIVVKELVQNNARRITVPPEPSFSDVFRQPATSLPVVWPQPPVTADASEDLLQLFLMSTLRAHQQTTQQHIPINAQFLTPQLSPFLLPAGPGSQQLTFHQQQPSQLVQSFLVNPLRQFEPFSNDLSSFLWSLSSLLSANETPTIVKREDLVTKPTPPQKSGLPQSRILKRTRQFGTSSNSSKKAGPQQKNNGNLEFSIVGLLESGQSPSKKAKSEFLHPEAVAKGTVVFLDDLPWMDGRRIRRRRPPCSNEAADPSMDGVGKGNGFLTALPTDITEEDNNDHRKRREGMRANASAAGIHVCQQCGKSYATSSNLSRHKQTHRKRGSYSFTGRMMEQLPCPFCDRVYVSMPALGMHKLTHEASHKCSICGRLFSRPWLLKGHLRSHTGQKPFTCGNCGKSFSDRSNLRAHLNTHKNGKKLYCELVNTHQAMRQDT